MTLSIYSIYDTVAKAYGPLFSAKNDGVALRNYDRFICDTTAQDKNFRSSDYELRRLGNWDDEIGSLNDTGVVSVDPLDVEDEE